VRLKDERKEYKKIKHVINTEANTEKKKNEKQESLTGGGEREIQRKKEKRETHRKEAKYDCFNE
jgi:hypothetical protein